MEYKSLEELKSVVAQGKPASVADLFAESYLQGVAHSQWLETMQEQHQGLFPETVVVTQTDIGGNSFEVAVPNPDFVPFETWMAETAQVVAGTRDELQPDGSTLIVDVIEEQLVRPYLPIAVAATAIHAQKVALGYFKVLAAKEIEALMPEHKQRNALARTAELHEVVRKGGVLTAAEEAELTAILAAWAPIKAIRDASNLAELAL